MQSDYENDPLEVIKLNAGPDYIMKQNDICFYMSISKEENSSLMVNNHAEETFTVDDGTGKLLMIEDFAKHAIKSISLKKSNQPKRLTIPKKEHKNSTLKLKLI